MGSFTIPQCSQLRHHHHHPLLLLLPLFLLLIFSFSSELVLKAQALPRHRALNNTVSAIFVFGDSTSDPGNNNYVKTIFKGNFPPYGRDFVDQIPTGRFTNGRLSSDYISKGLHDYNVVRIYVFSSLHPVKGSLQLLPKSRISMQIIKNVMMVKLSNFSSYPSLIPCPVTDHCQSRYWIHICVHTNSSLVYFYRVIGLIYLLCVQYHMWGLRILFPRIWTQV